MVTEQVETIGIEQERLEGKELLDHVRSLRERVYDRMVEEGDLARHNDIVNFARRLKERYPDYNRHKAYHVLVGSTVEDWQDIDTDFPDEDSVAGFLERMVQAP